jgi:hypothetical protein
LSLLLVLGGLVVLYLWVRPGRVIRLQGGQARCIRGVVPAGLLADLDEVARSLPQAKATVSLSGAGDGLRVAVKGLDEGGAQRVRNTVNLHRRRL